MVGIDTSSGGNSRTAVSHAVAQASEFEWDEMVAAVTFPSDPFEDIPQSRHAVWHYYGLKFFSADGYPMSEAPLDRSRVIVHPMHGAYMIAEYVRLYVNGGRTDRGFIAKALKVARSAMSRMSERGDALCFLYSPNDAVTPHSFEFYSALTQVRYLEVFSQLHEESGVLWLWEAAARIFESMRIPVSDGGIMLRNKLGVILEEYPAEIPTFVLNGWLSTLIGVFQYGYAARNQEAIALAKESTETLIRLLPLYDMPEVWNTRYKLSGYVLNRLDAQGDGFEVSHVTVNAAGETVTKSTADTGRYQTVHVLRQEPRAVVFRVALSMVQYPTPSKIACTITANEACTVHWSIGIPQIDPRFPTPKAVGQRRIRSFDVPRGTSVIELEIPWDLAIAWIGTATPFSKLVLGRYHNVYHFIHVQALSQLFRYYKAGKLIYWRDRWLDYTHKWAGFAPYCIPGISHSVIDREKFETQDEYLETSPVSLIDSVSANTTVLDYEDLVVEATSLKD